MPPATSVVPLAIIQPGKSELDDRWVAESFRSARAPRERRQVWRMAAYNYIIIITQ